MSTQSDTANDTLQQKEKERLSFFGGHLVVKAFRAEGVVTVITLGDA